MQEATGRNAQLQDVRGKGGGGAETEGHVRTATTSTTTTTTAAPTPTYQGQGQTSAILSVSTTTTTTTTRATTYNNDSYDEKQSKQQNQQQQNHDSNNHSQQQKLQQVNSSYSIYEEDSYSSGFNQLILKAKGSFKRKKKQQHKQQPKQQPKQQQQCNDTDCENSGDGGHNHLLSKRETSSKRKKKKKQNPKQQLQLQGEGEGGVENSGKEGGVSESERSYRFLLFSMCCSKTMVQKSMQWLLYLQQSKPSGSGDEQSSSLHQGQSVCGSWNSTEEEELLSGVVASPREEEEGQECVITVEPLPTGLRLREEAAPPPSPPGGGTTRPYCAQNNREQIGERLARHWGKWLRTPSLIPHAFATFCGMVQPIHHWHIRNPT